MSGDPYINADKIMRDQRAEIDRLQQDLNFQYERVANKDCKIAELWSALSELLGAVIAGVADRRHIDRAREALAKEGK